MLDLNETQLQYRIQVSVTNGLGFLKSKYSEDSLYSKYLSEEETKNTNSGLKAHLAEMNLDRDIAKFVEESRLSGGTFGILKARFNLGKTLSRNSNLRIRAAKEAIRNRGGLFKVMGEYLSLKYAPVIFVNYENNK